MNRRTFLGGLGLLAVGSTTAGLVKNEGDIDTTISDGKHLAGGVTKMTYEDGTTEFGLLTDFEKVSWLDHGDLEIHFKDDPDMMQWGLISQEPEREIIETGFPPQYGGRKTVRLRDRYPLQPGTLKLIGAKYEQADDSRFGMEADRTSTVTFPIEPEVSIVNAQPASDSERVQLTIKNTGTTPTPVKGAKITGVPTEDNRYEIFQDGSVFLLPNESTTVLSRRPVLASESCTYPEQFDASLYTSDQLVWNQTATLSNATENRC
jgi:hypothetical protein